MTYQEFTQKFHISLNPQQTEAVQAVDGAILLLAVPGSGKTTVLVTRLGFMLHVCGIAPEQILTMTYTTAAAQDMRQRFIHFFGAQDSERLEFRTIHSVCVRIIRQYERSMGRTAFRLLDNEKETAALLSEIYQNIHHEFLNDSTRKEIQTGITYIKNMMLSQDEIEDYSPKHLDLKSIYQAYCAALRRRCLMDFDDQLVYALQILRSYPQILSYFQQKYRYLCVDEAQDTSKIQHEIIHLLASGHGNLFMVGDEDQSIYGFRAAYPAALMSFASVHSNAKVLLLEQNYRSTKQIVAAADAVIRHNRDRHPKQMKAARGNGADIKVISLKDRSAQYQYLVKVAENCTQETAILYRNNDSALPLIDLFDRAGISYQCRQFDASLFSHRIIQDVRDLITFADEPQNGEIFSRIYYKMNMRARKEDVQYALEQNRKTGEPLLRLLLRSDNLSKFAADRCKELIADFEALRKDSGAAAIKRIAYNMEYQSFLNDRGIPFDKLEILQILGRSEPSGKRLMARLDELAQLVQRSTVGTHSPLILSTIHSSKGLEYERVYLADVADGILPSIELENEHLASNEERKAYEEERRLFYVGITRAKDELNIFRFSKRGLSSSFLKELRSPPKAAVPAGIITDRRAKMLAETYHINDSVEHTKFGRGVIINKEGHIITIRFEDRTEKLFLLTKLIQSKLINHC